MPSDPIGTALLADVVYVYAQQRKLAEQSAAQLNDEEFFRAPAADSNSVAVIMKHVGGNLRSRWSDFLHSDGEKPDRNRDGEFIADGETRAAVMSVWSAGWATLDDTLASLTAADLAGTVAIRGEPNTVLQALVRNLGHASHHAGQIVLLAKAIRGENWQVLSIKRGESQTVRGNFWAKPPA